MEGSQYQSNELGMRRIGEPGSVYISISSSAFRIDWKAGKSLLGDMLTGGGCATCHLDI